MARVVRQIAERITTIRSAWKEIAPQASFAGRTLEQFTLETEGALQLRAEIESLERRLEGRKVDRSVADDSASDLMELVVNSVKGTPTCGPDSPLYRAMGYVRKSERSSGLTRKGLRKSPEVNAA